MKKVQIAIQVDAELRRKVKIKAAKTGKTLSQVVREALEKWVKDE